MISVLITFFNFGFYYHVALAHGIKKKKREKVNHVKRKEKKNEVDGKRMHDEEARMLTGQ